jgi:polar amino acid transport system substrate-binding protein
MGKDADDPGSDPDTDPDPHPPAPARLPATQARPRRARFSVLIGLISGLLVAHAASSSSVRADTLAKIRRSGRLVYGSDKEGGGPYAYPDPDNPRGVTGFEVDMMRAIGRELDAEPVFAQGQWDKLLQYLNTGRIDMVVNGYEWSESRAREYLATRPYYVYQLQVMAPRTGPIRSWDDLLKPAPNGKKWRVGVLGSSAADAFARDEGKGTNTVEVVSFDGATDAMTAVRNGQIDATLQDGPAATFYAGRFPDLARVGPPVGHGYYVIFVRRGDPALRAALDRALDHMIASGSLRRLYEKSGLWNEAQDELAGWTGEKFRVSATGEPGGWRLLRRYSPLLLDAALMTVLLSVTSMPLAMAAGLLIALGRMYGPSPLKAVLTGYVELLRGTPLMLQLFVLFYLLRLPPLVAGIAGLAINYSAYEAEIYRAGLQAIPAGQMEAAMALGMSRRLALRRVVVPQAVRIVIPPVTNDFIALFKDTSVCSAITLVELTKQYSILGNSTGGWIEFALATSALYLAMSVPLSWFSRWSERRLGSDGWRGGAMG